MFWVICSFTVYLDFRISEGIKKIKEFQQATENFLFSFKVVSEEEVKNTIKVLPINKPTIYGDITTKSLKHHDQIYFRKLANIFNEL